MHSPIVQEPRVARASLPSSGSPVAELSVLECDRDGQRVALPYAELQIVARFGVSARGGLDAHAMGVGQSARRKMLRRGQRSVMARLRLGASERVLGVSAPELTGRIVALEDLWGKADTEHLYERLAGARDTVAAAAILESAIVARSAPAQAVRAHTSLALEAAKRLATRSASSVSAVADELGVSERHLRRLFLETLGVGPKAYAKLTRFHRALRAARESRPAGWAGIAAGAGYYDQAHLIAEFRSIAGVTPRELLGELRTSGSIGRV
ncbi:helix-turn-helix domain-containing protein [Polyangium sp. y55x31]|uniref:helix-turn-helix transcriptional regulator n=1 Tax=Polyangium sp. y55x31 TaxID=3042688 RepID=UPI0024830D2D|nr:helix-turn-helix domain-containing protein [Polyangium sp. y55x31]MDI1479672.1 helix-turn-helix domain-containing protein [Polyangium sp. y55x31]